MPAVPVAPAVPTPPGSPAASPPSIPATVPTGKVYVLLLADDGAKDGDANKNGVALVERLLKQALPAERLGAVVSLRGTDITQERIRDRLAVLPIKGDDAIVCFYSGPETYDDATQAFTLTPDGVKIPRTELRAELQLHKPGLIVLFTDAPAYGVQVDGMKPVGFPATVAPLDKLLLGGKGLIDVNAAAGGEIAFARGKEGGLFTLALVQALAKGPTTWAKAVADAAAGTNVLLKQYDKDVRGSDAAPDDAKAQLRRQRTQTVTPFVPLDPASTLPPPVEETTVRTSNAPARPAAIVVKLPAGAQLFIDGEATQQATAERYFETPNLPPGRSFWYALRAEFASGGRTVVRDAAVEVRAGDAKVVVIE